MVKLDHGKRSAQQEQHRNAAIARLGLLTTPVAPIFDEAVQMVAQFLDVPVVWFGVPQGDSCDCWRRRGYIILAR